VLLCSWCADEDTFPPSSAGAIENRATLRPVLSVDVVELHKGQAALAPICARDQCLAQPNYRIVLRLRDSQVGKDTKEPRNKRRDNRPEYPDSVVLDRHSRRKDLTRPSSATAQGNANGKLTGYTGYDKHSKNNAV
jgi:hypothetical protein